MTSMLLQRGSQATPTPSQASRPRVVKIQRQDLRPVLSRHGIWANHNPCICWNAYTADTPVVDD